MSILLTVTYRVNVIPVNNPAHMFAYIGKWILKFMYKLVKTTLEKKR